MVVCLGITKPPKVFSLGGFSGNVKAITIKLVSVYITLASESDSLNTGRRRSDSIKQ